TMAFALALIPAVLFPLFRQYSEVLAVGAVIFRGVLEALSPIATVVCWLVLLTLSRVSGHGSGLDASLVTSLSTLILAVSDAASLVGAIAFNIGALFIYTVFYRARLIPRWISVWALVGAALYIAAQVWGMFDPNQLPLTLERGVGMLMIPTAIQEMFMAGWLIVKGFNTAPQVAAQSTGGRGLPAQAG
ncbi:MAG TPA: DUF4386 domain-containing protein, partial [Anaerolineales bacterium]|nr:DUF4386 domain-containing protein [Anaerolineales bacterium]